MWHWKWLLWYNTTWLWNPHFRWAQPGQLHVSVPPLCYSVRMYKWENTNMWVLFRFFLMYLINKDETEHTGQVSLNCFITVFLIVVLFSFQFLVSCCEFLFLHPLFLGVVRVEDVPGALLGLLPCWRLFQKAIWGSAFLANKDFIHTEGKRRLLNSNQCLSFLTKLTANWFCHKKCKIIFMND